MDNGYGDRAVVRNFLWFGWLIWSQASQFAMRFSTHGRSDKRCGVKKWTVSAALVLSPEMLCCYAIGWSELVCMDMLSWDIFFSWATIASGTHFWFGRDPLRVGTPYNQTSFTPTCQYISIFLPKWQVEFQVFAHAPHPLMDSWIPRSPPKGRFQDDTKSLERGHSMFKILYWVVSCRYRYDTQYSTVYHEIVNLDLCVVHPPEFFWPLGPVVISHSYRDGVHKRYWITFDVYDKYIKIY